MSRSFLPYVPSKTFFLTLILSALLGSARGQSCTSLPSIVSDSNVTTTSATVYFTDAASLPASGYNWEVVLTGAGSGGTAVVSGSVGTGIDSVSVSGLTAATAYDFYIQSNCGGVSGVSTWAGPFTFTTLCTLVNTFPYSVFNSATLPACWTATAGAGALFEWAPTTADATYGASGPETGTYFMYLDVFDADIAFNTYNLTSPPIALPSTPQQLSYYYFLGADGYMGTSGSTGSDPYPLAVQVSTDGGLTWTDIYDHSASNSIFASSNSTTNWHQNIINLSAYANQTILIQFVSNSNYGFGICNQGLDQFLINAAPTCLGIASLSSSAVTTTSATVYWGDASPVPSSGYNWIVVPTGAGTSATPVVSGTSLVGDDSTLVTGLSASTTYDFYIQSNCGGTSGVGNWAGPQTFTTACGNITSLPWLEGFEGLGSNVGYGILPPCWTSSAFSGWATDDGPLGFPANITSHGGSNYLYDYSGTTDTIFTPSFALTGGVPYLFSYYYQTDGNPGWDSIKTMYGTTGAAPNGLIGNVIYNPINTGYVQFITQFTPAVSGNYYFGVNENSYFTAYDIAFDDFELQLAPPCAGIPNISIASNLTATTAVVYWSDATPIPSNGYNWIVVPAGAGTSATPVASGTSMAGDDSSLVTGLTSSTTYDFYLQTNCGGIGNGIWVGPVTFTTPCPSITLPLAQGFNQTTIPTCWSQQYVNGASDLQYVASSTLPNTVPQEGSDFVWWNSYDFQQGIETRLVSPPINTTGVQSVDVSFYWYNEHSQYFNSSIYLNEGVKVQYSTNGTTWTTVQFYPRVDLSMPLDSGKWTQKYLTLPLAAGNQQTLYVGFSFVAEDGDNCSFDHLNITPSLPCPGEVSAVTPRSLAPYAATIGWTAAPLPPADGYNWRVVPTGDSVNGVAIDSGTSAAGVDSALVTGLTPNTTYDIYIQNNCGGVAGVGYWDGPATFSTPCVAVTSLPWTEGFEGLGRNVGIDKLPPCWVGVPSGRWTSANGALGYPPNIGPRSGTNYVYDRDLSNDTLFTPGFALTGGVTYEFYYYYQTDGYTGWDSIITMYGQAQDVAGMTNRLSGTIYSPVNTDYHKYVGQFTPAVSGTYYFGVNLNSSISPSTLAFDDFGLKVAPPCAGLVSNITVSNLVATAAVLSWTAATPAPAAGYNWVLVAAGDSANSTPLFSGSTAAGIVTTLANNISPETSYDLYVQTNCGGALGVGDWVGPVSFTTPCAPITSLPWHEGFEGLGTNTGTDILPICWLPTPSFRWTTANIPLIFPPMGPRSGSNFLYDYNGANDTVYTPGFNLTAGTQYEFYFYYETDGNTGWDSLFVMYGPSQTNMTARIGPVDSNMVNTTYQKYSAIFTAPATGAYYFGVKLFSNFNPETIAFDDFGLQEVIPCPNPPLAGTIAGPSGACPSTNVNLTLTGYSPFTVLQWQGSQDSINFTDLTGANQDVITTVITATSYYRVKVMCADSTYSPVFPLYLNSATQCYCTADLGGSCGPYNIDTLALASTNFDITNAPCVVTNSGNAYTQFPDTGSATTTLQRGGAYTLSISTTDASKSSAWVDYNQDGIFEPSEWVQLTNSSNSGSATLNIPLNAVLGKTGFRVRTSGFFFVTNDSLSACTRFFQGETFDFYVTIVDTNCNHAPSISASITNVTPCYGDTTGAISLTITGSNGPYSSVWSNADTGSAISNLAAGVYTDTINFDYGCRYITGDTVTQPGLVGHLDSIQEVKCFGNHTGAIYVTVGNNTIHHWSSGDTSVSLTGKAAGIYTDTITNAGHCLVLLHDTITQPATGLAVRVDSTHEVKCFGQSNGAVYITASGGTAPYHYSWSNSTTSRDLLNVPAHQYTVNVTDTNGCTATVSDSVPQPPALSIVTDSIINASCYGLSNGAIYVLVSGGTPSYNYTWTGGIHSFNLYLKPAGSYTLAITDANNCTLSATDSISQPGLLGISSQTTNQVSGGALGSINTTVTGGTQPYKYKWSNGDSTADISNLTAAIYTVTVTDKNGCSITKKDTVTLINSIIDLNGDVRSFAVYPNPSSGIFNVQVELSHAVPVRLEVYNITGELIPLAVQPGQLSNTYQIDLGDQTSGVYLIKLIAGDYTSIRKVTLIK